MMEAEVAIKEIHDYVTPGNGRYEYGKCLEGILALKEQGLGVVPGVADYLTAASKSHLGEVLVNEVVGANAILGVVPNHQETQVRLKRSLEAAYFVGLDRDEVFNKYLEPIKNQHFPDLQATPIIPATTTPASIDQAPTAAEGSVPEIDWFALPPDSSVAEKIENPVIDFTALPLPGEEEKIEPPAAAATETARGRLDGNVQDTALGGYVLKTMAGLNTGGPLDLSEKSAFVQELKGMREVLDDQHWDDLVSLLMGQANLPNPKNAEKIDQAGLMKLISQINLPSQETEVTSAPVGQVQAPQAIKPIPEELKAAQAKTDRIAEDMARKASEAAAQRVATPEQPRPEIITLGPGDLRQQVVEALKRSRNRAEAFDVAPETVRKYVETDIRLSQDAKFEKLAFQIERDGDLHITSKAAKKIWGKQVAGVAFDGLFRNNQTGGVDLLPGYKLEYEGAAGLFKDGIEEVITDINGTIIKNLNSQLPPGWQVKSFQIKGNKLVFDAQR